MDILGLVCPFLSFYLPPHHNARSSVFTFLPPASFLLDFTFNSMSRAAACSCCAGERCQGGCGDPQMVRVVPAQPELGQVPLSD